MLIYAQLEDAVINRVKSASDANALGYRLAHVDSYGGEFDDETFFTHFRKFPAVWVTVGGDVPKKLSARTWECQLKLAVMVGSRNVRGERFTRHGTVQEPGSYQLAQDVRDLLVGQDFGSTVDQKYVPLVSALDLGPTRTLFNTRMGSEARSVLAVEFSSKFTYRVPEEAEDGNYVGINLRYCMKPGDDVADVVDVVNFSGT